MAQALFNNWWNIFGANWEIIGSSRSTLADLYGFLLSSNLV